MDQKDKDKKENEEKRKENEQDGPGPTSRWARYFPDGYFTELKEVLKLSTPMILIQCAQMLMGPMAIMFCGHLGKNELDAVSLAVSIINVSVFSSATGLATACDTIFSQTYGSIHRAKLGICLQKSLLMLTLAVFPVWAIYLNAGDILVALGQDYTISWLVDRYMKLFMPGVLFFYLYITFAKYLQTQNIVMPSVVIGVISNLVNAAMHYVLVYHLNLGTDGSAIAMDVAFLVLLVLTVLYIIVFKIYKSTWDGWRIECLTEWGVFGKIAFFGLLMICFEWWAFEFAIFASGILGTTDLGAQSVIYQNEMIWYMFPFGTGIAASIRVGQFLGAKKPLNARATAWVSLSLMTAVAAGVAILFASLRNYLPYVFTRVPEVVELASHVFPVLGLFTIVDALSGVGTGIIRGCGRQVLGTVVIALGYTGAMVVGIPIMLMITHDITTMWACLCSAVGLEAVVILIFIIKTNWQKEVEKANERIKITEFKGEEEENQIIPHKETSFDETGKRQTYDTISPTPEDSTRAPKVSLKRLLVIRTLILIAFVLIFIGGLLCRLILHDGTFITFHSFNGTDVSNTTLSTAHS